MTNSQLKKQAQKLLEKWQKTVKIGDVVKYYPVLGGERFREYTVKSDAMLVNDGTDAQVFLNGFSGLVCLSHLVKKDKSEALTMRTIEEVLAENPNAMFSCSSVEYGAYDGEDIIEQIQYRHDDSEKPKITYCKPNYFTMNAKSVLESEAENWDMAYEDWELECSDELRAKLQSVLDEIVADNRSRNTSYSEGEELNIDEIWAQMEVQNDQSK